MTNRVYQELHRPLPVEKPKEEEPKQQRGVAVLNPDGSWEVESTTETAPGEVEYLL